MSQPQVTVDLVRAEKRARFNPLADLTPEKLTTYLSEFKAGHLRNLAIVMQDMEERDDVLASVVPKAKSAVSRHGFEVLTVDTNDAFEQELAVRQKEVLEKFYNNLTVSSALDRDEIGGMSLLVRQMMDAKGKRYAVHNIVWKPSDGGYTATLYQVPLWFFENTEGRLRFIDQPFGYYGKEMDPGAWLVTKGSGLMIPCAVAWMFKHLPLRDWLIYCERHGMPGIDGATDAAPGSEEWEAMVDAVAAAANDFAWVRSRNSELKVIDFSTQGELPFPKLVDRMDRMLASIWRGADLSTMSSGVTDGHGASLQGEESDIIEQDDAAWISEVLNYKLDRQVLSLNFGADAPALAYVRVLTDNKQDIDRDLKIDEFALRNGHPLSKKQFAERYSRPLPDEGDELLVATASPAPSFPSVESPRHGVNERLPFSQDGVAAELGVPAGWLNPVAGLLQDLERRAQDRNMSEADLLKFLEKARDRLPELFDRMDHQALADVLEGALGAAVLEGVKDAMHTKR
ncbi:MAG: DUF935 family protein [Rhodospirillaceae bacterium]